MEKIRVAVVGVGNCASSLIQGVEYYRGHPGRSPVGLINWSLGGFEPSHIEFVASFDVDERKVGKRLSEAIFAPPNCTMRIVQRIRQSNVVVSMGPVLDGVSDHMKGFPKERTFLVKDAMPVDVEQVLVESKAEILLNYLPVGSERATRFYARCCLNTGVSLVNCIPVFTVSDPAWGQRFKERNIPVVGDDIKSQLGATILHRALVRLFEERGVKVDRSYQLNVGGNTDFLNMLNRQRLRLKKVSKTEAVESQMREPLGEENLHIGPSDYVAWLLDNKVCFLRMEGRGFGGAPINLELRLSVEDSPNSAGIVIDVIRLVKLARLRRIGGPLTAVCAYAMKHPPQQIDDRVSLAMIEDFVAGGGLEKR